MKEKINLNITKEDSQNQSIKDYTYKFFFCFVFFGEVHLLPEATNSDINSLSRKLTFM